MALRPSLLAILAVIALPARAGAYESEVTATTIGQGYQLRRFDDRGGSVMLSRRRVTQLLSAEISDLVPTDWTHGGERNLVFFSSQLRFDYDFGDYARGAPGGTARIRELPDPAQAGQQFDLLHATLSIRSGAGLFDADLGRQVIIDHFDYFALDGLDVRAHVLPWLVVEGLGGLEVRGAHPFGTDHFELDGTSTGSRDRLTCAGVVAERCPDQANALAPVLGGAVALEGLGPLDARVSYRRTWSRTAGYRSAVVTEALAPSGLSDVRPESAIDEEKLSLFSRLSLGRFFPYAGLRWNVLVGAVDEVATGLDADLPGGQRATAGYAYLLPTFEGDSIWNVFSRGAYQDARVRWEVPVASAGGTAHVRAHTRVYEEAPGSPGGRWDRVEWGAGTGLRRRTPLALAQLDAEVRDGFGGLRAGADGLLLTSLRRVDLEARLSLLYFESDLETDRQHGLAFGAQAGARFQFARGVSGHLLLEENLNRLVGRETRALAILDLTLGPQSSPHGPHSGTLGAAGSWR